jgi:hypothetical protein
VSREQWANLLGLLYAGKIYDIGWDPTPEGLEHHCEHWRNRLEGCRDDDIRILSWGGVLIRFD